MMNVQQKLFIFFAACVVLALIIITLARANANSEQSIYAEEDPSKAHGSFSSTDDENSGIQLSGILPNTVS